MYAEACFNELKWSDLVAKWPRPYVTPLDFHNDYTAFKNKDFPKNVQE